MDNLDYRALAVLDAVASQGSFEKAANALGISQPAVSQRIKALEDALAEIERYTSTRFVLADQKLGAVRVSGRFHTGNVNAVRLALRQNFRIASRRDTRGRIVLWPAHAS